MVENRTGLTDLDEFDSTLPEYTVQNLRVEKSYIKPKTNIKFIKELLDRDVISSDISHKKVGVFLEVENIENDIDEINGQVNKHSLVNYNVPVVSGSYTYDPNNKVVYIGSIIVQDGLRERGLGTQMKKQLNNMIKQESKNITCYTWLASGSGKKLAKKTGFSPDKKTFSDVPEIWSRRF